MAGQELRRVAGRLGYELEGDIGGPMFINEAYRWNLPVIYYGFDKSFVDYFGQPGIDAVEQAIAILNALPPVSEMSADLSEFPLDTKRENGLATALNLIDLKSCTLVFVLEQLGLANPERFVWGLRERNATASTTNYVVLRMNYDPVTLLTSSRVNNVVYDYEIFDGLGTTSYKWATASEWSEFDPQWLFLPYSSVAGGTDNADLQLVSWEGGLNDRLNGVLAGQYFSGLTRDDVGGLRYLLRRDNKVWELLAAGVTGIGANSSNVVNAGLRGGLDKLAFMRLPLEANGSQFVTVTNSFPDVYYTSDIAVTQALQRVVTKPDILFRAQDLGGTVYHNSSPSLPPAEFYPALLHRSDTSRWANNSALNQPTSFGGPGVIPPGAVITCNKLGRYFANPQWQWGSFDGSEDYPIIHRGSETNHDSIVLETRLIQTNGVITFEWTTLLSRDLSSRYFRMEQSTDLQQWESLGVLDSFLSGGGPLVVWQSPVTNLHRFFRAVKTDPPPE